MVSSEESKGVHRKIKLIDVSIRENFLNFCYLAAYDPYSGEWHQKVAIVRGQVDGQPAGRCQAGPGVCVSDAELRDAGLEADPSDHGQRLVHLDYR